MNISEDAKQDAWVALLERPGGPSSVARPEAWLHRTARAIQVTRWRQRAQQHQAENEYLGLPDHPEWVKAKDVNREKSSMFRKLNPDYYKGKYKKRPLLCGPPPPRYVKMPSGNICIRPGRPRKRRI